MKLTHSDISEIREWCVERNHCKKEFPPGFVQLLKDDTKAFPTGQSIGTIMAWWREEVELVLEPDLRIRIIKAIYDNTAMEDARLPHNILNKLERRE